MPVRPYRGILPKLASGAWVDPAALVIGDVELGADTSIWPMAVVRGDVNHIRIGERSNVQDGTVIHCDSPKPKRPDGFPTIIGDDVVGLTRGLAASRSRTCSAFSPARVAR